MKHKHVFTQTDQTPTPEGSRTINYFRKIETLNWDGKRYAHCCVQLH